MYVFIDVLDCDLEWAVLVEEGKAREGGGKGLMNLQRGSNVQRVGAGQDFMRPPSQPTQQQPPPLGMGGAMPPVRSAGKSAARGAGRALLCPPVCRRTHHTAALRASQCPCPEPAWVSWVFLRCRCPGPPVPG